MATGNTCSDGDTVMVMVETWTIGDVLACTAQFPSERFHPIGFIYSLRPNLLDLASVVVRSITTTHEHIIKKKRAAKEIYLAKKKKKSTRRFDDIFTRRRTSNRTDGKLGTKLKTQKFRKASQVQTPKSSASRFEGGVGHLKITN